MSFLIIIVSLVIIGAFWRQILKGSLISLFTLLVVIIFLFSFFNKNASAEEKPLENGCYESDHRFDEQVEFFAEGYKIIVSNHPILDHP